MDDLGGMGSDDVNAQKFVVFFVADDFDFTGYFIFCMSFTKSTERIFANGDIMFFRLLAA